MKTTMNFLKMGLLVFAMVLTSCSAEDGEDGVTGPQGVAGTDGIDGTDGADGQDGTDGTDGEDGNANVIYSEWLDANWNITDNATNKRMQISIAEISNTELRNKTLIYMYLRQFGTSSIYTMPSSGRWSNTWYSFTFGNNGADLDGILVALETTDGSDLTEFQYTAFRGNRFRYVLVPQESQTGKLDYSNYEAVKAFYNLPD